MNFIIRIAQPPGIHWQCFIEAARGIDYALNKLGHSCTLDLDRKLDINSGRLIVFNAQSLPEGKLPYDAIIFNAEQVQLEGQFAEAWRESEYVKNLRKHVVWDYSTVNINRLQSLGIITAVHCAIGYYPNLTDIASAQENIDVLFIGSLNDHRRKIINEIAFKRLRTHVLTDAYGQERNEVIARSKLVLNTHFYPNPIWEIFRCSYMMANKKCVVTEDGGNDTALEKLAQSCVYASPDKIAETCRMLIDNEDKRKEAQERGFAEFSKLDQVEFVREALKNTL